MVKHVVMWKLEDVAEGSTKEENELKIAEAYQALVGQVDGLVSVEVGRNFNGKGIDLVLCVTFESKEALKAYDTHPAHLKIHELVRKVITERTIADYEVE